MLSKASTDQVVPAPNPLVLSVRKVAVEIRLKWPGPASHEPRSIRELSPQQKSDSALAYRIVDLRSSRFLQREERLDRSPTRHSPGRQLRPPAVDALRTHDESGYASLFGRVRTAPA